MQTILLAGATGNLGHRIAKALIEQGATVRALTRSGSAPEKVEVLKQLGAEIIQVDMHDPAALTEACRGAACVVSALQGLEDVIVDAQTALLEAAVAAGVPRFIPSDYSTDITAVPEGQNRNFDLRRRFRQKLDAAAIQATSVFNGAFAEVIGYNPRLFNRKDHQIGYYGEPDFRMDFTTMDDTAAFTAAAALDDQAPRDLHIASFQVSAEELASLATEATGTSFKAARLGSPQELDGYARHMRASQPEGEREIFPAWQQMQYVVGMSTVQHPSLDNDRYPNINWTPANKVIQEIASQIGRR